MIALIQRVRWAKVEVADKVIGEIDQGLLALVGMEKQDSQSNADKLLEKVLSYRVFADDAGKMNQSLRDIGGGLLLVSQFTLAADTGRGLRPSFSSALLPAEAESLWRYFTSRAKADYAPVACGEFAADMQVSLQNDGPVTFWLQV